MSRMSQLTKEQMAITLRSVSPKLTYGGTIDGNLYSGIQSSWCRTCAVARLLWSLISHPLERLITELRGSYLVPLTLMSTLM